jgi:hypothetical protein
VTRPKGIHFGPFIRPQPALDAPGELIDVEEDPGQGENLAGRPDLATALGELRALRGDGP